MSSSNRAHAASRLHIIVVLLATSVIVPAAAQESELERHLGRLSDYLETYEKALGEIVADEVYVQRVSRPGPRRRVEMDATGLPLPDTHPAPVEVTERRLQSTLSFMRLPGGAAWLGTRAVRRVDDREVADAERLFAILKGTVGDVHAQATAMVQASIQYHLGNPRSVNMPTPPLELVDRRHRDRMTFRVSGHESVGGVRTTRIAFAEKGAPTLIRGERHGGVISRGVVWTENSSGAVWRAQVFYREYGPAGPAGPEAEVLVEFKRSPALAILVPERMREVSLVDSGRGEGEATYSNYRRFTTSGRIVPPGW